jgi:alpha-mannosidase
MPERPQFFMRILKALPPIILLILCFHPLLSMAQTKEEEDAALATLSPASRTAIQELASLRSLPAGEWRFHAGEIPHGEAMDLDDSAWETRKPGSTAPSDSVWYRRLVEIPARLNGYDLTGSRIWFQFRVDVNGPMTQIIYFNGKRVAMGEDLEPLVLFDSCKPGDKILVAVKLLQTVDQKIITAIDLPIDPPPGKPNPTDTRQELLSAAMLIPSLAGSTEERKRLFNSVDAAAQAIDIGPLYNGDQQVFETSLHKSADILTPLRPLLQQATYHLTGNSHIDAAWLWSWTESVDAIRRTWGTALQLMKEYPNYTFTQSAAQYNLWMAEKYPSLNEEIKNRIKEGRWEVVGGMWIEPDLNMPDGESLVRQLLIGKRTFMELYGVDVRIGWNPDSFGYNWQLPQIYKRSGIDYFVTQKLAWNDTNPLPLKLFWWQSPDGSKVLAYFPHNYDNDNFDPARLAADLVTAHSSAPGLLEVMDLYGIGDHGGGASRYTLEQADHWRQPDRIVPKMQMGTAQTFFNDVQSKIDKDSPVWNYSSIAEKKPDLAAPAEGEMRIPTWNDELYFEYHRGTYTTQANHKREMRESEEAVLDAEKYAALASFFGGRYPHAELDDAWKKILFNQFHDLAAGSGVAYIYKDAVRDYDEARRDTNQISVDAIHEIQAQVNTQGAVGVPVLIFNSLAWPRTGVVKIEVEMPAPVKDGVYVVDAKQKVLPSQVLRQNPRTNTLQLLVEVPEIPSLGYEIVRVIPGKREAATDLHAEGLQMENEYLRVTVDPQTGCISSLYDKKAKFESLAEHSCGNELIAFKDTPKAYDAWNIDSGFDKVFTPLERADSVTLLEKTPLRILIRVIRHWQSSKFIQDYVLYAYSDELEVVNDFDWHEDHILLKTAFTLAAAGKNATYEIPYGSIERPTTRDNSWEKAKFEVPALRWADSGDAKHGFSLLNESKYGYDAVGNVLRLSLLRSPTWPDPQADRGSQRFSYRLYPHSGAWKDALTVRRGYEFNYKLQAVQVIPHVGTLPPIHSFLEVDAPNVVLTAMKKSEDGEGVILRFYEWKGKGTNVTLILPEGATSATATSLMEKPEGEPLPVTSGHRVVLPVHPYEIVTVRVNYSTNDMGVH